MKCRSLMAAAAAAALSAALVPLPALAQSGPIRIGVPTAVQLQVGRDTQVAVTMAIEEINAAGGINGKKLEVVFFDDQCEPREAATVSTSIVNDPVAAKRPIEIVVPAKKYVESIPRTSSPG